MQTAPHPHPESGLFRPQNPRSRERPADRGCHPAGHVQVLVKDGEAALTTNRMAAERAGVSVGTLYQYFPDKQAVFSALLALERHAPWPRSMPGCPK